MNVHTLLADAAASVDTTVDPATIEADLARGRRALGRRRVRRTGVTGLAIAGLAIAGVVAGGHVPGVTTDPGAPTATPQQDAVLTPGSLQLVNYTGDQLAGYRVDEVPDGWALLHSDEHALTIGPAGVPDTNPDSYLGKFTVLLVSTDKPFPAEGTPVTVGATPGLAVPEPHPTAEDPFDFSLFYVDAASGQSVRIQVPAALHWTAKQAAEFPAGVHVTDAAQRAHG